MLFFTLLALPLPSKIRAPLLNGISKPFQSVQVQVSIKSVLIFILILFVDAFNKAASIDKELKNVPVGAPFVDRSEIQAKRFYAQRNLYLTGFTLFLTLIITRTYSLVAELIDIKKTVRGGSLESKDTDSKISKSDEIAKLKEQQSQLQKKLDALKN